MKQHRSIPLAALLLALCLTLAACGGSSASSSAASAAPAAMRSNFAAEAPMEMAMAEDAEVDMAAGMMSRDFVPTENQEMPVDSNRKIVRNAWLSLETKEFDDALLSLNSLIAENGGYIESQSEDGRSLYHSGYYSRNASITARVPADRLDAVINATEGFCNVVSRSLSAEDISDRYFDSEAHLKSLTLQEERLLEILSKAEKLEDVITLEQALSQVRYEIESLTAALRRMDSQVSYSSLNIDLAEVVDYQQPVSQPKSFGERIAASWGRSAERIADIAEGLVLFSIEILPSLLLFVALPVAVIVWILRAVRRGRRDKKKPAAPPSPAPDKKDE